MTASTIGFWFLKDFVLHKGILHAVLFFVAVLICHRPYYFFEAVFSLVGTALDGRAKMSIFALKMTKITENDQNIFKTYFHIFQDKR